jgi:rubrerythrin
MADEYISREDVIKKIAEVQDKATTGIEDVAYYRAIKIIRDMPAADVQPVKRGRWIDIYEYCEERDLRPTGLGVYYWCSECGEAEKKTSDFCPNCGARMKED